MKVLADQFEFEFVKDCEKVPADLREVFDTAARPVVPFNGGKLITPFLKSIAVLGDLLEFHGIEGFETLGPDRYHWLTWLNRVADAYEFPVPAFGDWHVGKVRELSGVVRRFHTS